MTARCTYLHPYNASESAPLVSIIMPAYNTAKYIDEAIQSALQQTVQNIEVIVVDDASTDGTPEVVKAIEDPRVRLYEFSENLGAAAARNQALQEAKGQWVAVLDSDDWYAPNRLESLLAVATETDADMVSDDMWFIEDGNPTPWTTLVKESGRSVPSAQLVSPIFYLDNDIHGQKGLHLGLSKPLINRNFLIEHHIFYKSEVRLGQDFFLYLECLIRGAKFIFQPKPYYYYRSRSGSLFTKSQVARLTQACKAAEKWLSEDIVKTNEILFKALSRNLKVYQQNLAYYSVIEPLKQPSVDFKQVVTEMIKHPYFFVRFIQQVPRSIQLRLSNYFHRRDNTESRRTA